MNNFHIPVLIEEVLNYLNIQKDLWYIDATLGGGGHTEKILKLGGRVIGIDQDEDSIKEVSRKLKNYINSKHLILIQNNFTNIDKNDHQISGILFDLGVSSHQLDTTERGFSFRKDAELDMRMDKSLEVTAQDLINGLNSGELTQLFEKFGEEKFAKKIAKIIVLERQKEKITTTGQLADLIKKNIYSKEKIHPATRVFQALRIAVNDELNSLKEALPKAFDILEPGGKLIVISFHSLEDRIVKNFFKELEEKNSAKILTDKPIEPSEKEVYENPRSRSSKLRAIEKIK